MTDILRVNNTILSWESCTFRINGIPYNGILDFSYELKRERKVVYGAKRNGKSLGKTAGKFSVPSCSLKMLRDSADDLTSMLTLLGQGSYGDAEFVIIAQYIEPIIALPITIVCSGCTIDGEKDPNSEGIDELVTEFEIGCLDITKNGKSLASIVRSIP